jgi:hypothetical protein
MGSDARAAMAMIMASSKDGGSSIISCRNCSHQITLTAGTTMQATKLPRRDHGQLQSQSGRHRRQAPQRPATVPLD